MPSARKGSTLALLWEETEPFIGRLWLQPILRTLHALGSKLSPVIAGSAIPAGETFIRRLAGSTVMCLPQDSRIAYGAALCRHTWWRRVHLRRGDDARACPDGYPGHVRAFESRRVSAQLWRQSEAAVTMPCSISRDHRTLSDMAATLR